jgi:O-antigen/teichoic acid export membrane protein
VSAIAAFILTKEKISFGFRPRNSWTLFKMSVPLGLMLFCNLIYFRADIFLLSFFTSQTAVGIYGYAYRYFDFLIALPLFLSNSLYPIMLSGKNTRNGSQMRTTYGVVYVVSGIFISSIAFLLAPIIGIVKPEFLLSILPFRILLISLPIFFLTSYLQWILIVHKRLHIMLGIYIFSAVLNIVLNYIFIPTLGYIGAAWITDISELIVLLLLALTIFKTKIWNIR